MIRWLLVVMIVAPLLVLVVPGGPAFARTCGTAVAWNSVDERCQWGAKETNALFHSNDGHHYSLQFNCAYDAQRSECGHGKACKTADGATGTEYEVYRDDKVDLGPTCLAPADVARLHSVTPAQVLDAARRLAWPKATLIIQPPGGETLVNLPTVYYTTTTQTVTRPVSLLGVGITVQAWPESYTWVYGDGDSYVSTSPGEAVSFDPNGRADLEGKVHHEYRRHGAVSVRVDVTYAGRYRVDGGRWQDLPGTLTVPGDSQRLQIRTAHPVLLDPAS